MRITNIAFVAILALFLSIPAAKPLHAELLASVYPGAVPVDEELADHERPFSRLFYARDSIADVVAFYEQELGSMEEVRPGRKYQNVDRHPPRFAASLEPEIIGVTVFSEAPADREQRDMPEGMAETLPDRCNSEHFASLRTMAHQMDAYSWDDFREVCDRFEHLDWAYFRQTDEKDSRGHRVRKDQVMLAEQERSLGVRDTQEVEMDMEAMAQRIEELQRQGRFQEMADLARKMQEGAMGDAQMDRDGAFQDNWDEWVAYLEDLDEQAYQTRILIHRDPSTWPDKPIR